MLDGKSFPSFGHIHYVCNMCGGATSTWNGHFLGMNSPKKISAQYTSCMDE